MKSYKQVAGLLSVAGLSLALGACSSASAEPFEIKWGETECEVCKMKIMDEQFAAEAIMENEKGYAFDDIGCLMRDWYPEQKEDDIAAMYVKDFNTKDWVELDEAMFVYDKESKTPMAYNILSFAKEADAEAYMEENGGKMMNFDQLKDHTWERGEMNMMMDGEGSMDGMNQDSEMDMEMDTEEEGQ
ncbi:MULTISPECIES: nitrous oxide reductase accessory protein NosL [Exiguobacterium]|uniref:nitrous oxide reductase accessory protein NosL n=1 Tax=Exiguobacterium TaxID=33986 RepID=UPI001CD33EA4|nr:nitrous oxide reductase accessory protein NosL [Exiguobacterium aestuarii]MCA0982045.1 nitrous oxide reductase accessory protein NosL [Exiguobacterium aestuarii]